MKFSLEWLKYFLDTEASAADIAAALNRIGHEVEGIEDPEYRFCLGVQWHPEFFIDPGDRRIFEALVAAARG